MSRLRAAVRLLLSFTSFGAARGATFLAPIALAAALPPADYGLFEAMLAYAMIVAVLLNFGTSAAIPYFTLEVPRPARVRQIYQHLLLLISALSITAVLCLGARMMAASALGLTLVAHICSQRIMSAQFMTDKASQKASFASGYVYVLLLLAAVGGWGVYSLTLPVLSIVLLCGLVPIALWAGYKIFVAPGSAHAEGRWNARLTDFAGYLEVLRFSGPTLMLGMGILGVVSLVRLIALPLVGAEELAEYAVTFRLAGVAVVLYQFLAIVSFRRIYQSDPSAADRQLSAIALLCIALAIVEYLVLPYLPQDWFPMPQFIAPLHNYGMVEAVFVMICGWIAMALTENLLYRYNLAMQAFLVDVAIFSIAIIGLGTKWRSQSYLGIEDLATAHAAIVCAVAVSHCVILWRNGIRYRKLLLIGMALFLTAILGFSTDAGSSR